MNLLVELKGMQAISGYSRRSRSALPLEWANFSRAFSD
eukprot:CAMPEP_0181340042 /NCGR_PEP_ID=MMETSP1101-20121128/29615_1 /TAXON_ID=46948 /ORGANISM="Rhodomonas abbreviata, Strain Caron Lab Isolate" /LENGTH=37 /DNA_ID= /DNA_START= /DNA_END= /DNA_ORIENTATION=